MVERFNGRIGREVLVMCIGTHQTLECLLKGYNLAYNARRQRVLDGRSPDEVVSEHLKARPELINLTYRPPDPCSLTKTKIAAQLKVLSAKEVSQPDTSPSAKHWRQRSHGPRLDTAPRNFRGGPSG